MVQSLGPAPDDHSLIVTRLWQILNVKKAANLVRVVQKLEKVVRAVPRMETFIKEIGLIVEPNLKDEKNNKVAAKRMNGIMPTLKSWIQELGELRALKTAVCQELEISTQAYRDEILSRIPRGCNMETEIVHHFKNLFDI